MDDDFIIINEDNIIEKSVLKNLINMTGEEIFVIFCQRVKYGEYDMKYYSMMIKTFL